MFHTIKSLPPLASTFRHKAQILIARGSKELGQAMNHHPMGTEPFSLSGPTACLTHRQGIFPTVSSVWLMALKYFI